MFVENFSPSPAQPGQPKEDPTPEQKAQLDLARRKVALLQEVSTAAFAKVDHKVDFAQRVVNAAQAAQSPQETQTAPAAQTATETEPAATR